VNFNHLNICFSDEQILKITILTVY